MIAFFCYLRVNDVRLHVFHAFHSNVIQTMFEDHNFFLQIVHSTYETYSVAILQTKGFWHFHWFILAFFRLFMLEEEHELMGHVMVECAKWNIYLGTTLRTLPQEKFFREDLFTKLWVKVNIHGSPKVELPMLTTLWTVYLFFA